MPIALTLKPKVNAITFVFQSACSAYAPSLMLR